MVNGPIPLKATDRTPGEMLAALLARPHVTDEFLDSLIALADLGIDACERRPSVVRRAWLGQTRVQEAYCQLAEAKAMFAAMREMMLTVGGDA